MKLTHDTEKRLAAAVAVRIEELRADYEREASSPHTKACLLVLEHFPSCQALAKALHLRRCYDYTQQQMQLVVDRYAPGLFAHLERVGEGPLDVNVYVSEWSNVCLPAPEHCRTTADTEASENAHHAIPAQFARQPPKSLN